MGVLGWPPLTVMRDAELTDLEDAYEGYMRFHGLFPPDLSCPTQKFMAEMMNQFPDEKG